MMKKKEIDKTNENLLMTASTLHCHARILNKAVQSEVIYILGRAIVVYFYWKIVNNSMRNFILLVFFFLSCWSLI